MYQFSVELRELLEKQKMALAVYQLIDEKVVTVLVSDGFCQLRHDTREHLISALDHSMFERVDEADAGMLAAKGNAFAHHQSSTYDVVYRTRSEKGEIRLMHTLGFWQTMSDGSEVAFLYYINVTNSKESIKKEAFDYNALQEDHIFIDLVTKIANLNYFHKFCDEKINALVLDEKQPILLYFNLNDMRSYNRKHGYKAGNELLRLTAKVLKEYYPNALVTRGSDDHFLVMTDQMLTYEQINEINMRITQLAAGHTNGLKAAVYALEDNDHELTAIEHVRQAYKMLDYDLSNRISYYKKEMSENYLREREIIDYFSEALENHQIRVFYQRIIANADGHVAYGEALARWFDQEKGMISPGQFIPVLRKYQLLYKLDLYMVSEICREYHLRKEKQMPLFPVSVNLSAQDFDHANMYEEISKILKKNAVPVDALIIEITEENLAKATTNFREQIDAFQKSGFKIWVDDFGSAYSSLNVFTRYHFNLIKFDQGLIGHLTKENKVIVEYMIQAAKRLNYETLCEGVETKQQEEFVKQVGGDFTQGFYFYKPAPIEDIINE